MHPRVRLAFGLSGFGIAFAVSNAGCIDRSHAGGSSAYLTSEAEQVANLDVPRDLSLMTLPATFKPGAESQGSSDDSNNETTGVFVPQNAYWSARLAAISYLDASEIPAALARIGLDTDSPRITFYPFADRRTSTEGFYVASGTVAFLVFRGSQQIRDWLTDAAFWTRRNIVPKGRVHAGFAQAFSAIWHKTGGRPQTLRDFVAARHYRNDKPPASEVKGPPLYVVGHSLGGALANLTTLFSSYDGCIERNVRALEQGEEPDTRDDSCNLQYIPLAATYTFGQPRVGDEDFAFDLGARLTALRSPYYRFSNSNDLVTGVPPRPYRHVGLPPGKQGSAEPAVAKRNEAELAFLAFLDYDGNFIARAQPGRGASHNDGCFEPVTDHNISQYAAKLRAIADDVPFERTACKAPPGPSECDSDTGICSCTNDFTAKQRCCNPSKTRRCTADATMNPACAEVCL